MSVIWDLLQSATVFRESGRLDPPPMENRERRQSSRITLYVPVFVYGYDAADEPFHEQTNTLLVNANGGLLHLSANLRCGQRLLLTNRVTEEEQECYVVTLARRPKPTDVRVGVAFSNPAPGFWGEKKKRQAPRVISLPRVRFP